MNEKTPGYRPKPKPPEAALRTEVAIGEAKPSEYFFTTSSKISDLLCSATLEIYKKGVTTPVYTAVYYDDDLFGHRVCSMTYNHKRLIKKANKIGEKIIKNFELERK